MAWVSLASVVGRIHLPRMQAAAWPCRRLLQQEELKVESVRRQMSCRQLAELLRLANGKVR